MGRPGKGQIIGSAIAFVCLLMLSAVMLIAGFLTNSVFPIYISIFCSLLGTIAFVILIVRVASYTSHRPPAG